jgi:hypothetical protein
VRAIVAILLLAGCADSTPRATYPPFDGHETDQWLAYDVALPGREPSELLPAFEASAHAYGCTTEQLGYGATPNVAGESRSWYGVSADCDAGRIAIMTLAGERVRIGCARPATREQCDALLQQISQAR